MYQLTANPYVVVRLDDDANIPLGHRWWDDFQEWLAAGNTPRPALDTRGDVMRAQRDAMLRSCDWTQVPDAQLTAEQKAAWASYRQALRDVPAQAEFPGAIDWPTLPATPDA